MGKYDDTNRGALFKNTNRRNDADPEYTGYIHFGLDRHQIIANKKISGPHSKNPNTAFFAISFKDEAEEHDDFESPNQSGSGVLFKNEDRKEDSHPNYRGSIEKGDSSNWLSAWLKESGPNSNNPGMKFLSLSITPKDTKKNDQALADKVARSQKAAREFAEGGQFDDDIPF